MPDKHIRLSESLIGLGGFILDRLQKPRTIDVLWLELQEAISTDAFPAYHTFENLMLSVDFLFSIGTLGEDGEGKLFLCA